MGPLILGYVLGVLTLASSVAAAGRAERQVADASGQGLRDLRANAETRFFDWFLGGWALAWAIAGMFLVLRDRPIGWAWFGVAALLAGSVWAMRRRSRRILATIGDRGQVDHGPRYTRLKRVWTVLLAIGLGATFTRGALGPAFSEPVPKAAEVVDAALGIVGAVALITFAAVRGWSWSRSDHLPGAP